MRYDWKEFRPALRRAVLRLGVIGVNFGGYVTQWKLRRALADNTTGLASLKDARFMPLDLLEETAQRHIRPRIALVGVGGATLRRVETRCQTALPHLACGSGRRYLQTITRCMQITSIYGAVDGAFVVESPRGETTKFSL